MTYSSIDTTNFLFFVVGGNSTGTDTGRIYLWRKVSGETDEYLDDVTTSTTNWAKWTVSSWTSYTQLILSPAVYTLTDSNAQKFGISTMADVVTLGFNGSKLFTGVKIL